MISPFRKSVFPLFRKIKSVLEDVDIDEVVGIVGAVTVVIIGGATMLGVPVCWSIVVVCRGVNCFGSLGSKSGELKEFV